MCFNQSFALSCDIRASNSDLPDFNISKARMGNKKGLLMKPEEICI